MGVAKKYDKHRFVQGGRNEARVKINGSIAFTSSRIDQSIDHSMVFGMCFHRYNKQNPKK